MQLETISYERGKGWSETPLPNLDSPSTLVLVFGAPEYGHDPAPIEELLAAYPHSTVVGCSTSGEILGDQMRDHSLSVAIARFENTSVAMAVEPVTDSSQSEQVGHAMGSQLAREGLRGVLVFSDGLKVNGTALVNGLNRALPDDVTVTGGLAGDGDRFESTWIIAGAAPATDRVVAVGLYGSSIRIGHGSKGGWDIFGPERIITRSERNVLYELDGKPALELYKSYLGDRSEDLPSAALLFPLAIRSDEHDEFPNVRTILAVDEATQSMTFAGDVPVGFRAKLMRASFEHLIDGAQGAALMCADESATATPTLSIAISCVGRRLVLGERVEDELESTLDVLSATTKQVGFYSYGELSPLQSGPCVLQNQTMTLTTICES